MNDFYLTTHTHTHTYIYIRIFIRIHNIYIYIYIYIVIHRQTVSFYHNSSEWLVFVNGPGNRGSILGRVIPKTPELILAASFLNTSH